MKKLLPVILFVVGIGVFAGVYFFVIRGSKTGSEDEDANIPELAVEQRPVAKLIPSADGHWLKLVIEDLGKVQAASMDYELLYRVGDGRTQGVPGNIMLDGQATIERDLLLGSESSGKFRYDEGVETGTLTLRFRNEKGKLTGKLSTTWHLQTQVDELSLEQTDFAYTLNKAAKGVFFVTMEVFGLPSEPLATVVAGPYGVFASEAGPFAGTVKGVTHRFESEWQEIVDGKSSDLGIFISLEQAQ